MNLRITEKTEISEVYDTPNRALLLSSGTSFRILDTSGPAFHYDVQPDDFLDVPPFGLQVWEGKWKQTGAESWEMSWIKEYHLVGDFRPATEEEIEGYVRNGYTWNTERLI